MAARLAIGVSTGASRPAQSATLEGVSLGVFDTIYSRAANAIIATGGVFWEIFILYATFE